jgi:hypothetical protein
MQSIEATTGRCQDAFEHGFDIAGLETTAEVDVASSFGPDVGAVVHEDVGDVIVVEQITNEWGKWRDHGVW